MSRKTLIFVSALLVILIAVPVLLAQDYAAPQVTTAGVSTHPSQGDVREIEDGSATLVTTGDGAFMTFRTDELESGHVYTAWWIIINNPDNCAASPCTASDVLGNTEAVEADVTQADGIIFGEDGNMEFASFLPVGEISNSWFEAGFTNPSGAELHVVINDHGPLIPDMAASMVNTYRGGCSDESLPPPFPATAITDGEPGPNACRLIQDAIFTQDAE